MDGSNNGDNRNNNLRACQGNTHVSCPSAFRSRLLGIVLRGAPERRRSGDQAAPERRRRIPDLRSSGGTRAPGWALPSARCRLGGTQDCDVKVARASTRTWALKAWIWTCFQSRPRCGARADAGVRPPKDRPALEQAKKTPGMFTPLGRPSITARVSLARRSGAARNTRRETNRKECKSVTILDMHTHTQGQLSIKGSAALWRRGATPSTKSAWALATSYVQQLQPWAPRARV